MDYQNLLPITALNDTLEDQISIVQELFTQIEGCETITDEMIEAQSNTVYDCVASLTVDSQSFELENATLSY